MQISPVSSGPDRGDPVGREVKLCSLPPFSAAAARLIQLSEAEDVELRTIELVLSSDPAMAADVLRLANSPLFAIRNEVRSVGHAVVLLGLARIKALAVSVAMRRYAAGGDDGAYQKCWEHALACATIAEELAGMFGVRKEEGYTAGLLHDIGRIGLWKAFPEEYVPVLKAEYEALAESLALEQYVLRMDHCQSGYFLSQAWDFPKTLQSVAGNHHAPDDPSDSGLTRLIRLACGLAETIGFVEVTYKSEVPAEAALRGLSDAAANRIRKRLPSMEKRTREKMAYFLKP